VGRREGGEEKWLKGGKVVCNWSRHKEVSTERKTIIRKLFFSEKLNAMQKETSPGERSVGERKGARTA